MNGIERLFVLLEISSRPYWLSTHLSQMFSHRFRHTLKKEMYPLEWTGTIVARTGGFAHSCHTAPVHGIQVREKIKEVSPGPAPLK